MNSPRDRVFINPKCAYAARSQKSPEKEMILLFNHWDQFLYRVTRHRFETVLPRRYLRTYFHILFLFFYLGRH